VPITEDAKPKDPVSENMDALKGAPLKAFIYQDHQAHIAAHQSFMQDPMVAQMIGQNPQAKQIMAALQAHLAEHLGFQYRQQIEEKLGAPLPKPGEELPEEVEIQLSRLVADAGTQLTQAHQQQAAQKQAQQQAQDPILQLKQAEMQVKAQEVQRKQAKDQADIGLKQRELELKSKKDQADAMLEAQKLEIDRMEVEVDAQEKGMKMGQSLKESENKLDLEIMRMVEGARKPPRGGQKEE